MLLHGTTTIESKSGYGLNFKDEVKILQVNRMLGSRHPIDVVSTYLGAHAAVYPPSAVVTVIVTGPLLTPVTLPALSTVAIFRSLLDQVTF